MCLITASELKNNLGHYMELAKTEDVYVSKNGKVFIVLTSPEDKALANLDSLLGKYNPKKEAVDYDALLKERIFEKCVF